MIRRFATTVFVCALIATSLRGATLQKLSVEEMAQKATLIVRGRITGCAGEAHRSMIYTRCRVAVAEKWKGVAGAQVDFIAPGGSARGLVQTFVGVPSFASGQEYVLFLWAGKSGNNQLIGLSQGVFDLGIAAGGQTVAKRAASAENMLDSEGRRVADTPLEMRVSDLKQRVLAALEGVDR